MNTGVRHIAVPVAAVLIAVWSGGVQALGVGFFGATGTENYDSSATGIQTRSNMSLGFVFDSALRTGKLINYRMRVGAIANDGGSTAGDYSFTGLTNIHTLGFRIMESNRLRLWAGPELSLTQYTGYRDGNLDTGVDGKLNSYGLGAVFGMNLYFHRSFTLGWDLGIRNRWYSGTVDNVKHDGDSSGTVFSMFFMWRMDP